MICGYRRPTMRCTATAGVLFTFDAFFFIDYFGCAPPLPPPAVGELDSLGFAGTPLVFRCFSQRAAFAFFALAAFAAEPFPALPPRRPIAARYLDTALILVGSDFHAVVEAEFHLERPRLLFVGDLLGGEEPTVLRDCRVRGGQAVDFGDDVFDFVFHVVCFHVFKVCEATSHCNNYFQKSFADGFRRESPTIGCSEPGHRPLVARVSLSWPGR